MSTQVITARPAVARRALAAGRAVRSAVPPASASAPMAGQAACACGGGCPACAAPALHPPSAAPVVQRMSALDHSDEHNVKKTGVHPWPDEPPVGNDYRVQTDAGSEATAWVAYSGVPESHGYWCHGHSLDTYRRWGYSVYSGPGMGRAIADEYRGVAAADARAGDLAVWPLTADDTPWGHSARITDPVVTGGALDADRTLVSTKNGMRALQTGATLRSVMDEPAYGPGYRVYRRR